MLQGEVRASRELAKTDVDRMFCLMDMHFEGMDRDRFDADLAEKDTVLLLRHDETGVVEGFSTSMCIDTELDGQSIRAVFSGDTIINRDYWGEKTLGVVWLRHVLDIQRRSQGRRVYWFLISMGYKTYRLMRLFFADYWPRHSKPTPSFETRLISHLGTLKFGSHYDVDAGLVSFGGRRERLRCGVADVDDARQKDPDVAFFVERNPRWADGDELVCVAEIHPDNIRPRMWRIFKLETAE